MSELQHQDFKADSVGEYAQRYASALRDCLASVDPQALNSVLAILETARANKKQVYIAGNGGSCAIAEHLCCDWTKGSRRDARPENYLKTTALVSNGSLLTALANDLSYDEVFSEQLQMYGEAGEVLVVISSSGNSPNVINAVHVAREKGMKVIAFTGFTGGTLKGMADAGIHVAYSNYGVVEDCHQAVMHVLAQYMSQSWSIKK